MSSDAFRNDLALLLANNTALANIGSVAGLQPSSAAGSLFIGLHTADPGQAGTDQTTNEVTVGQFTNYARVAVARTAGGWTVAGNNISNAAAINFPECSGGSGTTVTHFSVGYQTSGATKMIGSAALGSPRAVSAGITLSFAIGDLDINVT